MRRAHLIVLGVLLVLMVLALVTAYYYRERAEREARDVAQGALFSPEATAAFTDLEGRDVDLSGAQGEIVIATSWASWCPQCAGELQLLNDVAAERNDGRVQVFALNRMEPKHQAQRFMSTLPDLPRVTFVLDNQDHFFSSVDGYAMPETIFYNQAGEIVLHKRGNLTREEAVAALDTALNSE